MKIFSVIKNFFEKYNLRFKVISLNAMQYLPSDDEVVYLIFSGDRIISYLLDSFGENPKSITTPFDKNKNYEDIEIIEIFYSSLERNKILEKNRIFLLIHLLSLREKIKSLRNVSTKIILSKINQKINDFEK